MASLTNFLYVKIYFGSLRYFGTLKKKNLKKSVEWIT